MSTLGTLNDETSTLSTILSTTCSITEKQRGYDYELLGGVDSKFECPICLMYMRDPVQTKCGHRFCRNCISVYLIQNQDTECLCPYCSLPISGETTFVDNSTRREILACVAKCPSWSEGCKVTLAISDMEKHVASAHPQPFSIHGFAQGFAGKPNSGSVYLSEAFLKQFDADNLGLCCYHQCTGYHGKKLRRYISRPNGDSPPSASNSQSLARQISGDSTAWLMGEDEFHIDDYNFRRQRSLDSMRSARRFFRDNHCIPCDSFEAYKKNPSRHSSGKESTFTDSCSSPVTESDIHIRDLMERLVKLEQMNQEKDIKITNLHSQLASAIVYCSKVSDMIKDLHTRYSNGILIWKVTEIEGRCKELRKHPTLHLTSSPFYTHQFGYKMCLRLNLTTSGAASSPVNVPLKEDTTTQVSMYIHFMQGDFDCTNEWPFSGEITLMIVHPTNEEKTIKERIRSKPDAAAFAKPKHSRSTKGIGYPDMCSLKTLFSEGYVQDDLIVLKVLAKSFHDKVPEPAPNSK